MPRRIRKERSTTATIFETAGDSVEIQAPYDRTFVSGIKALVPKENRSWNPETLRWTVDKSYRSVVERLLRATYNAVGIENVT